MPPGSLAAMEHTVAQGLRHMDFSFEVLEQPDLEEQCPPEILLFMDFGGHNIVSR